MAARRQQQPLNAGTEAPPFRLPLLSGSEASLGSLIASGPILLVFFKVSCPTCQLTFPFLERLHTEGTLPIYAVSQNDPDDTAEFRSAFGVTFPVLLDSEDLNFPVSNEYGISSVPTMFLIEPDGIISRVIEGWSKADFESLAARAGAIPFRAGEKVPEWKAG